jgi:hypothetical protein
LSKNRQWIVLSLSLLVIGGLIFAYKVVRLGYPALPDLTSEVWTVQVLLKIDDENGPVRAELMLPSRPSGFTVSRENFVSRGFGLTVDEEKFRRQAAWTVRHLDEPMTLYYRATVIHEPMRKRFASRPMTPKQPGLGEPYASALADIVKEVGEESADTKSFAAAILSRLNAGNDENIKLFLSIPGEKRDTAGLARMFLAGAGIPSLQIHGVMLQNQVQRAAVKTMLAVHDGDDWLLFDPSTGHEGFPSGFMVWWRGEEQLATVSGAQLQDLQISIRKRVESTLDLVSERVELKNSLAGKISILQLPIQTQSVYEVLLLVPFGIFVIVILRNFIGFSSFGTFAPVLIALAFRETELLKGIILFTLIVSLGLFFRFYLERLRLLLVPRLAAVVTIVVLLMTMISIISHQMGVETGLSVSLFPMVIISMIIERMSVVWEERGALTSIREGFGSLLMAALAYLVMSMDILAYWVSVFPEVDLIVLGVIVASGRYTGFRLSELIRFRQLAHKQES